MTTALQGNKCIATRRHKVRQLLLIGIFVVIVIGTAYIAIRSYTTPATNTITAFNFDTGYPLLAEKQNTPLNQTVDGITAHFSSKSETNNAPAFSIQSYDTTFTELSEFSGKYLYDNKPSRDSLVIIFTHQLSRIDLTFAIVEHHIEPSDISLTAYIDSIDTSPIGSATATGEYKTGIFPQGTLSFESEGKPFNIVVIEIPYQGKDSPTNFYIDNVNVAKAQ